MFIVYALKQKFSWTFHCSGLPAQKTFSIQCTLISPTATPTITAPATVSPLALGTQRKMRQNNAKANVAAKLYAPKNFAKWQWHGQRATESLGQGAAAVKPARFEPQLQLAVASVGHTRYERFNFALWAAKWKFNNFPSTIQLHIICSISGVKYRGQPNQVHASWL